MLLSEVALGEMFENKHALYVDGLPAGKHSTWGMGRTIPGPRGSRSSRGGAWDALLVEKTRLKRMDVLICFPPNRLNVRSVHARVEVYSSTHPSQAPSIHDRGLFSHCFQLS